MGDYWAGHAGASNDSEVWSDSKYNAIDISNWSVLTLSRNRYSHHKVPVRTSGIVVRKPCCDCRDSDQSTIFPIEKMLWHHWCQHHFMSCARTLDRINDESKCFQQSNFVKKFLYNFKLCREVSLQSLSVEIFLNH